MSYAKQTWVDGPLATHPSATPMSAARFNHMEDGIDGGVRKPAVAPADGDLLIWDAASGSTRAVTAPPLVEEVEQYQYRARYPESGVFAVTMTDPRIVCQKSVDGGTLLSFPTLARDGATVLCAYADGGTVASDGSITAGGGQTTRLKKSLDNGATWQPSSLVWAESQSSRAAVAVLANGNYLVSSPTYTGATLTGVKGKISTDKGVTWGTTFTIADTTAYTAGGPVTTSQPFQLANGSILQAVYGTDTAHIGTIAKVYVSTDNGATWSYRSTVLSLAGGISARAATFQQLASGTVVALVHCSDYIVRRTVSTDNGVTWSAPTTLFTDCDSRINWIRMSNGRSIACYRNSIGADPVLNAATPTYGLIRYSDDDFATYSVAQQVHGASRRESYRGIVQISPGICLLVNGELEEVGNHGNIFGRFLIDGHGLAPSGQNTYVTALTRARGQNRVAAYDTFNRPATNQGLGTADSGHQWVVASEYGNTAYWALTTLSGEPVATVPATGSSSVVLNSGVENGSIEADFRWDAAVGNDSIGLGLIARQSLTTGRSLRVALNYAASALTARLTKDYTATGETSTVNHTHLVVATSATLSYSPLVWHRAKLTVKGSLIRFYIDGLFIIGYTMDTTEYGNSVGSNTWWGLKATKTATVGQGQYFKNVVVSSI